MQALDPEQLERLSKRAVRQHVKAGTSLILEGDTGSIHTSLVHGVAKLIKTLPDGRRQIVGLQFEPAAISPPVEESLVSIEAATDMEICTVPASILDDLAQHTREVDVLTLQQSRHELDEARDWLLALGRKSALEKVASFILMLAEKSDKPLINGTRVTLPLARAEIGDFLGLTIETISRTFTRLRSSRVISIENIHSVTVLSMRHLKKLASK